LPELTHKQFDQKKSDNYGSIRERKVNPDLAEEREKCDFDTKELTKLFYGDSYEIHRDFLDVVTTDKEMQSNLEFYEMTREEMLERSMKLVNHVVQVPRLR